MSEWKEFTGSPEQTKELWDADNGYILRFSDKVNDRIRIAKDAWLTVSDFNSHCKKVTNVTHYLICNPHPLEDMICQQARTGQEVWVLEPIIGTEDHPLCPRLLAEGIHRENVGTAITENGIFCQYSTRTPYWHIPDAQYSFKRFWG